MRLSLYTPNSFFRTLSVSVDRNPSLNNNRNLFSCTAETPGQISFEESMSPELDNSVNVHFSFHLLNRLLTCGEK